MLSFSLGLLVLAACVAAPLPSMEARMPFSAHMMRHAALLLVAAPLLAMAIPASNVFRRLLVGVSVLTSRVPAAAWLCGVLVMWIWHVPGWYNNIGAYTTGIISCAPSQPGIATISAAAIYPIAGVNLIPVLHEGSLLVAGFLFCWPLVTPYRALRIRPLHGVLYLASACVCCSLLGLLITFAPSGTYRGITTTDQQTGGMIMWIPCCFVYLTASMCLLVQWLSGKNSVTPVNA